MSSMSASTERIWASATGPTLPYLWSSIMRWIGIVVSRWHWATLDAVSPSASMSTSVAQPRRLVVNGTTWNVRDSTGTLIIAPGEFFGPGGAGHVRIARLVAHDFSCGDDHGRPRVAGLATQGHAEIDADHVTWGWHRMSRCRLRRRGRKCRRLRLAGAG